MPDVIEKSLFNNFIFKFKLSYNLMNYFSDLIEQQLDQYFPVVGSTVEFIPSGDTTRNQIIFN